jgi:hypothetical protein
MPVMDIDKLMQASASSADRSMECFIAPPVCLCRLARMGVLSGAAEIAPARFDTREE